MSKNSHQKSQELSPRSFYNLVTLPASCLFLFLWCIPYIELTSMFKSLKRSKWESRNESGKEAPSLTLLVQPCQFELQEEQEQVIQQSVGQHFCSYQ